jgi:hypothetical protein
MTAWSLRRLSRARHLLQARRYLEIGVSRGGTFLPFEIAHKDAVDPRFRFDTAPHAKEGVRFFPITSDSFFARWQRQPEAERYDIIFLDGLHTYEQTLRDLCSALSLVRERFLIIIDDTVPSDIFSAERDPVVSRTLRDAAGATGNQWHGDVFKVVFFLHDFFPLLSYATIEDRGNPQTLIWPGARPDFAPMFNSTEAISRLTYADLLQKRSVLKVMDEDAAFGLAAAALGLPEPSSQNRAAG